MSAERKIHCYYDKGKKRWWATFTDPLIITDKTSHQKDFELAWTKPEEADKVLKTMRRDWKHHLVTVESPNKERHPALGPDV